ncbi:MAG: hypothetical protein R3279_01595 [Putridiphycobacter sp.]|nr:hypothetical protein [Putridiphycobacter sp.]
MQKRIAIQVKVVMVIAMLSVSMLACKKNNLNKEIDNRQFKMGFSTWSFGPTLANVNESYDFVTSNGDVYSEHMDHKVPWEAWMNGTELPLEFTNLVADKVNRQPNNVDLLLSISFLNSDRSGIMEDFNGEKPSVAMDDSTVIEAYFKHVCYLVDELQPMYLVYSIESNELLVNNPDAWPAFRKAMTTIGEKLTLKYPNLLMAESVTLHSWYKNDATVNTEAEVEAIVNSGSFAAISFYPFFKGLHSTTDFQEAFDFLHSKVNIPIAFVETNHLAEDLIVDEYALNIKSDEKEQEDYLATLLLNAHQKQYHFVIWWAHRDYDALWETFPEEVKALGKIWRDTGLKDENGKDRRAMKLWRNIFAK